MIISSIFPHHGEEPPISGTHGSGTVFFSYCTLKCCFCQNYQISHEYEGQRYSVDDLSRQLLYLQSQKCHNINLVTATHFLPWILRAIKNASDEGLNIPIVYNSGGYEEIEVIKHLDGIVDIYLPDMKYGNNKSASLYSKAPNYVSVNQQIIREMFRQTGPLQTDDMGIAKRGMCIRHLILPGNLQYSKEIVTFLLHHFDPEDISISLMAQYQPLFHAKKYEEINRWVKKEEYSETKTMFLSAGFQGFYQEYESMNQKFVIDFKTRKRERLTGNE